MREHPLSLGYIKDTVAANTTTTTKSDPNHSISTTTTRTSDTTHPTSHKRLAPATSTEDLALLTLSPPKRPASLEELYHVNAAVGQRQQQQYMERGSSSASGETTTDSSDMMHVSEPAPQRVGGRRRAPSHDDLEGPALQAAYGVQGNINIGTRLSVSTGSFGAGPRATGLDTPIGISNVGNALAGLRLATSEGMSLARGSPILMDGVTTPRSGSPAFAAPDLNELARLGVVAITAENLIESLRHRDEKESNEDGMDIDPPAGGDTNDTPIPRHWSILPVDLRYVNDFSKSRITGSVNVNLPMLMLKRFRRGAVSSFQMTNFVTGNESKELFDNWVHYASDANHNDNLRERAIVIYDDEMNEDQRDTEAWALVSILAKGLADDVWTPSVRRSPPAERRGTFTASAQPPSRTHITYLRGGYRSFQATPGSEPYLWDESGEEAGASGGTGPSRLRDSSTGGSAGTSRLEPSTPAPASTTTSGPPGFHIRTGHLYKPDNGPHSAIIGTAPPLTGDPGTPTFGRAATLAGAAGRERKKSAFSINTTKLVPQSRARGNTVNTGGPRRMTMLAPPTASSALAGIPGVVPGDDKDNRPPSSAHPSHLSHQLPEVPDEPGTPIGALPPTQQQQQQYTKSEHVHRRSVSEPRRSLTAGSGPSSPHNMQYMQLSPGPSTIPTPVEPVSVILPHLLLGSDALPQAKDGVEQLKALGVTHILNMAVEVENKAVDESGLFEVKWCLAEDHAEHDIEPVIRDAVDWIAEAHASQPDNIVFVHCKAGRSRSATTVIAYLVVHHKMRLRDAYETVKQARPGVSPNLGFMLALLRIEKEVHGENPGGATVYP